MIDLHSHIIPGIDDGPATLEQSLRMARAAVDDGLLVLAATPHHLNGRHDNPAADVLERLQMLRRALAEAGIPLRLLAGQEIRVTDQFWDEWDQGRLLTLAGSRYVLVELPSGHVPKGFADFVYELGIRGLVPVIAHPERNAELADNPDRLAELVQLGAWGQVTSHSLNGLFGRRVRKIALQMCRHNLIHIVASDAHDEAGRAFGMREALGRIERELDRSYAYQYAANAKAVVENRAIETRAPMRSRRLFGIWPVALKTGGADKGRT